MTQKKKPKKRKIVKVKDLTVPEGYSLEEIGISQSLINDFKLCPRKFLYKINRYVHESDNILSSFGNIIHELCADLYTLDLQKLLKKNSIRDIIKNSILTYEKENEDKLIGVDENTFAWEKCTAMVIMEEYYFRYPEDFKKKKFTDIEKEFSFMVGNYKINMKLDGRYKTKAGKAWLMEHKTKGRISEESMMKRLSFDTQNLTYVTGSEEEYKENIDGVLYNLIRKPSIKPKKAESLPAYADRLKEDIQKRPEFYFMRFEVPYTKKDKSEFVIELKECLLTIAALVEDIQLDKDTKACHVFYKNAGACEVPFPCKYLDACSSGTMTGYTQREKIFVELDTIKH